MWGLRSPLLLPGFSSSAWWCFQVWDTQAQSGLWWPGDVRGNYWFCLWVELSVSSARCLPYTNDHWDRALIGQLYPATDLRLDENLLLFTSSWWSSGHLSLSPVCKIETFLTLIVLQIVQLTSVTPGGRKQPESEGVRWGLQVDHGLSWFTGWRGHLPDWSLSTSPLPDFFFFFHPIKLIYSYKMTKKESFISHFDTFFHLRNYWWLAKERIRVYNNLW